MSDDLFLQANIQLLVATKNDDLERVKELIEFGVDINYKNHRGETPLNIAASMSYLDIVKYLIKKNADVNIVDNRGDNALMMPAIENHLDIVKELIKAKINIDNINKDGMTVLLYISRFYASSTFGVIIELIKAGANWLISYEDDDIFLDYLIKDFKDSIIKQFPKKYKEYLEYKKIKEQTNKFNL